MILLRLLKENIRSFTTGLIVGLLAVYLMANALAEYRTNSAVNALDEIIATHDLELQNIVTTIHSTDTKNSLLSIRDCSTEERTEFEQLLSSLETGLRREELDQLVILFDRCASYAAERRSLLTKNLESELLVLTAVIGARSTLVTNQEDLERLEKYQDLLNAEKEVNLKLYSLVDLQAKIIFALRNGVSVASEEADALRAEGGRIQSEIAYQSDIIELLRNELK